MPQTDPLAYTQTKIHHPWGSKKEKALAGAVIGLNLLVMAAFVTPGPQPMDLRSCDWAEPTLTCTEFGPKELAGLPAAQRVASYCQSVGFSDRPDHCHSWADPRKALAWEASFDFPSEQRAGDREQQLQERLLKKVGLPFLGYRPERPYLWMIEGRRNRFGEAWAEANAPWPQPVVWMPFAAFIAGALLCAAYVIQQVLHHRPPLPVIVSRDQWRVGKHTYSIEEQSIAPRDRFPKGYVVPEDLIRQIERLGEQQRNDVPDHDRARLRDLLDRETHNTP